MDLLPAVGVPAHPWQRCLRRPRGTQQGPIVGHLLQLPQPLAGREARGVERCDRAVGQLARAEPATLQVKEDVFRWGRRPCRAAVRTGRYSRLRLVRSPEHGLRLVAAVAAAHRAGPAAEVLEPRGGRAVRVGPRKPPRHRGVPRGGHGRALGRAVFRARRKFKVKRDSAWSPAAEIDKYVDP